MKTCCPANGVGINFPLNLAGKNVHCPSVAGLRYTQVTSCLSRRSVVRRLVEKLNRAAIRMRQESIARQIDSEPLSWPEKAARWKEETDQSETTFWRTLRRLENFQGKHEGPIS